MMKSIKHVGRVVRSIVGLCLIVCICAAPALADFQRTKIAVLDFQVIGDKLEPKGIGGILSEWFITSIVKSGRFDVVERAMLQQIIAEQKLSTTGMIDESSASKLGKILGVKVIITGSILKLRDTMDINARIIRVESGSIIAAENIRGNTNDDYHSLVEQLTTKIMRNFPLTGYIVKKNKDTAIVDLGFVSGLTAGTSFIVYKEGEVIRHPKTGKVLDVEQIQTGRLQIIKVRKNVAIGKIISEKGDGIEYGQLVKSVQQYAQAKKARSTSNVQSQSSSPPLSTQNTPEVVSLKAQKRKTIASKSAPVDNKPSQYGKTFPSQNQPAVSQPVVPIGSRNHIAVFPSAFRKQADPMDLGGGASDSVKGAIKNLISSKPFRFTNLLKDKRLRDISWNRHKPNMHVVIDQAKQRGIDFVVLYYFSYWGGQGLENGWGTDFLSPTFKVFLIDVHNQTIFVKETTSIVALDQLFIELKGMTRQLLEKAKFLN